jgi:hypothetical protein
LPHDVAKTTTRVRRPLPRAEASFAPTRDRWITTTNGSASELPRRPLPRSSRSPRSLRGRHRTLRRAPNGRAGAGASARRALGPRRRHARSKGKPDSRATAVRGERPGGTPRTASRPGGRTPRPRPVGLAPTAPPTTNPPTTFGYAHERRPIQRTPTPRPPEPRPLQGGPPCRAPGNSQPPPLP